MSGISSEKTDPHAAATELLRKGTYFEQSKSWYGMVYLNPLSERFYFIIVGLLALAIFICSVMALNGLGDLRPAVPIYYGTLEADKEQPSVSRLRGSTEQTVDNALLQFYLSRYVERREGYDVASFAGSGRFIQNYSSAKEWQQYQRIIAKDNPRSPLRLYGRRYQRSVEVRSVRAVGNQAQVQFIATERSKTEQRKSYWTATVRFTYSGITQEGQGTAEEPVYGLPTFQVSGYESKEQVRR